MILSAVSLWKKFDMSNPLQPSEWGYEEDKEAGMRFWNVTYAGHKTEDGSVRVFAKFGKPASGEKFPAVLLLPDAGKELDQELLYYFIDKGYAVLMPDYSGETDGSAAPHTGQITWIIVVSFQGCTASLHLPCMMRCCPLQ